ncbi:MAG: hypothetical protein CL407_09695 [Acidimicrobiaceae bacterium]|nr:hypothetical protein [Acidimicrobiaceae bacterium]
MLVVDGNVNVSNTLTVDRLTLNNVSISTTQDLAQVSNVGNVTSNILQFTNPTTAFVTTGNVGIGTTSPDTLLELSKSTGSATISPTELRLSTTTNAADWSVTDPWARLSFYTDDVSGDAPGVMASVGAVASSADGGENTRLAFFTAEPHLERMCVDRYGNVGIGTTNPSAGKLDILVPDGGTGIHIRGGDYGSDNGEAHIRIGGNGVTSDSISHHAMITGGHTSAGSSYLSFSTLLDYSTHGNSPVERMRIDQYGNVGIGSTSPGGPLHVKAVGSTTLTNESPITNGIFVYNDQNSANQDASIAIRVAGSSAGDPFLSFDIANEYGWAWGMDNSDGNKMKLGANWHTVSNDTKMTIDTSGNVGIGTTSPLSPLDILAVKGITTAASVDNLVSNATIRISGYAENQDALCIGMLGTDTGDSGNNPHAYIQNVWDNPKTARPLLLNPAGGSVGIGTTDPGLLLDCYAGTTAYAGIRVRSSSGYAKLIANAGQGGHNAIVNAGDLGIIFSTDSDHTSAEANKGFYIAPWDSGTRASGIRINENGNVGIGTTSPDLELHIHDTTNNSSGMIVSSTSGYNRFIEAGGQLYIQSGTAASADSRADINFTSMYNSTSYMKIEGSSGNVGIGTTGPNKKLHVQGGAAYFRGNAPGVHIQPATTSGGGQNLFTGFRTGDSYGRAQLVLSSAYSDVIIASSQVNNNHGSNLSFVTYDPNNSATYRKFVINQGNWGTRKHFLDFGYGDKADPNPHGYINATDTVMVLDGVNKRMGLGSLTPGYKLSINGSLYYTSGGLNGSDDRIKYNERNISNALTMISQLKPQKYEKIMEFPGEPIGTWIPTDEEWENVKEDYKYGEEFGFIAQDVRKIPELSFLVHGEETRMDTKTVSQEEYSNLSTEEQVTFTHSYTDGTNIITQEEYSNIEPTEQEAYVQQYTKQTETETPLGLNYQGLFVVAISAIQELKLKNDALEARIASLENA